MPTLPTSTTSSTGRVVRFVDTSFWVALQLGRDGLLVRRRDQLCGYAATAHDRGTRVRRRLLGRRIRRAAAGLTTPQQAPGAIFGSGSTQRNATSGVPGVFSR